MSAFITYIGATIGCFVGVPATVDDTGFAAITYVPIGKIVSWGAIGDTSADVTADLLDGRVEHANGILDGGEVAWTVRFDTDPGQTIMVANSNNNLEVSFEITDPDGAIAYFYGKVANVKDMDRAAGTYKGLTGVVRINSPVIRA
jgi:hypothetical protein